MQRREFLQTSAFLGVVSLLAVLSACELLSNRAKPQPTTQQSSPAISNPLTPPAGNINVAFVISDGTVMIDLAGPWEVFQDVWIPSRGKSMNEQMPFRLYTVAEKKTPITASGGMKIQPDYTFANAPVPNIIVIPAQNNSSDAMLQWIKTASKHTDLTMSVCTGAFILAKAGLLSGKPATTHHAEYGTLAMQFPDMDVKRGVRFIDDGKLATSGGLSSGIDLALHVVERYFGRKVATETAFNMEYQGQGWLDPASNAIYAKRVASAEQHPRCPVCTMEVDPATAPKSVYKAKTYYFCSGAHKSVFDAAPEKWQ